MDQSYIRNMEPHWYLLRPVYYTRNPGFGGMRTFLDAQRTEELFRTGLITLVIIPPNGLIGVTPNYESAYNPRYTQLLSPMTLQVSSVFWWLNLVRLYSLYKMLYPKRRI